MITQTVIQMNETDLRKFLYREIALGEVTRFLSRFHNVFVTPEEVANIHGVSRQTVYNHIKYGNLVPELRETENASFRFRLSDVLQFDFRKLRKHLQKDALSN
jgi:predicted DNA-binding transcriptional regulator AlpA